MNRYDIHDRLGDGSYGSVWSATSKETGERVAIKRLKRKYPSWSQCIGLREIESLRNLQHHPNILKVKELIRENDSQLYFVFEFMQYNLYQLIKRCSSVGILEQEQRKSVLLPPNKVKDIIRQSLSGLEFIHQHGFIHRDIKPENILISGDRAVLGDFGLTRQYRKDARAEPLTEYISTRWYRAPEILLKSPSYSCPIDIFAIGCVMFELIELKPLFPGKSYIDQIFKVFSLLGKPNQLSWPEGMELAANMRLDLRNIVDYSNYSSHAHLFPPSSQTSIQSLQRLQALLVGSSSTVVTFIHRMLTMDPDERLTASECLEDAYFQEADFVTTTDNNNANVHQYTGVQGSLPNDSYLRGLGQIANGPLAGDMATQQPNIPQHYTTMIQDEMPANNALYQGGGQIAPSALIGNIPTQTSITDYFQRGDANTYDYGNQLLPTNVPRQFNGTIYQDADAQRHGNFSHPAMSTIDLQSNATELVFHTQPERSHEHTNFNIYGL